MQEDTFFILPWDLVYYDSENYTAAIRDLTKVIEVDQKGNVVPALYIRAQCKNRLEDYRGALIDYNTVLLISAENKSEKLAVVYLDRGRVNVFLENYNEAEQELLKIQQATSKVPSIPLHDAIKLSEELALFEQWFLNNMLDYQPSADEKILLDDFFKFLISNATIHTKLIWF